MVNWSLSKHRATFARPIAGVSWNRAERRPQRAIVTGPYGATWPMECTSSAALAAAAAPVSRRRNAPRHSTRLCWGPRLNDLHFYDRQAQGGCNLHEFARGVLEEFLGFCLRGLMRSDDFIIRVNFVETSECLQNILASRSTCLAPPIFVALSSLCPCLETHVGMRACLQCMCQHGLICRSLSLYNGGGRMWVLSFLGLHWWGYSLGFGGNTSGTAQFI